MTNVKGMEMSADLTQDQERAEFEAWHGGLYQGHQEEIAFAAWQASRRTPSRMPEDVERKRLFEAGWMACFDHTELTVEAGSASVSAPLPSSDIFKQELAAALRSKPAGMGEKL